MSTTISDNPHFLVSNKGQPLLVLNGNVYKKNKETKIKKYWICQTVGCCVYVHTTIGNVVLKITGNHNHLTHPEHTEIKNFRTKIKQRAKDETTPLVKIYEEVVSAQMQPETLAIMPLARELQPGLTYCRRKLTPDLPDSAIFEIPEAYQVAHNNEPFLARDILIRRRKRMLIFCSKTQLELLFDSPVVMMDGTFNATPPFFDQIYSMHALKFDTAFPCVFGILPGRKKHVYQEMFKELKNLAVLMNRTFEPIRILTDYEPSIISAIKTEFPNATHNGCYFHLTQAIYRRVQEFGLNKLYAEDADIRTCIRKLMALPLLPLDKVQVAYNDFRTNLSEYVQQTLHQLFIYFDRQWMQNTPLELWNIHGQQLRTNNVCEGYHNRLNHRIERSHPNIWSFIKCIQGEEVRFRHMMLQMNAGAKGRPKTETSNAIQHRIDTLNERFKNNEINLTELLAGLSLVIAKQKT